MVFIKLFLSIPKLVRNQKINQQNTTIKEEGIDYFYIQILNWFINARNSFKRKKQKN